MHTLKEILAEPQTMYDGGVVRMVDGGDTREEALKLRQKAEQIEVPEEPTSTGTSLTPYIQGAKKLVKGVAGQAVRRIPGVGLIDPSPVADATIPGFMTKILEAEKSGYTEDLFHLTKVSEIEGDVLRTESVVGSDIGIHVTDKKGINFYTDLIKSKRESWKPFHKPETKEDIDKSSKMRDDLVGSLYEKVNILPLKGKLDNTITIPDMGSFRTPSQWIKEMSTTLDPFGFP